LKYFGQFSHKLAKNKEWGIVLKAFGQKMNTIPFCEKNLRLRVFCVSADLETKNVKFFFIIQHMLLK